MKMGIQVSIKIRWIPDQVWNDNNWDAKVGGDIAGGARRKLEKRLGRSIVSKENFLLKKENTKKISSRDK